MAKTKKSDTPDYSHFEQFGKDVSEMEGYEDIDMSTMSIPFIRLLQDLSPQLKKQKPEFIAEAEAGMFVNTISEKLYDAPLRVVIGKFERYYIEWGTKRGQYIAAHLPADIEGARASKLVRDEKNKLVDPDTGHTFQDTYVYYVILPDHMEEGICIMSIVSTGIKEAKKLNRNLMATMLPGTTKRALPYFMIWSAEVVTMSNDQGDWFGLKFRFDSFVDQVLLENVVTERKALPNKPVNLALLGENTESDEDNDEKDVPY